MSDIEGLLKRAENILAIDHNLFNNVPIKKTTLLIQWSKSVDLIRDLANHIRSDVWQDIATAPKDGTDILVLDDKNDIWIVYWGTTEQHWCVSSVTACEIVLNVTHWQPLPSPPADNKESK